MSKEFPSERDLALARQLAAIKESILRAPDEEIIEDMQAQGDNPVEVAERCRHIIAAAIRRTDPDKPSRDDLIEVAASRATVDSVKSRIFSLLEFLQSGLAPVPALGEELVRDIDVREVLLSDAFQLSKEELEKELCWCGPSIEIARTYTETGDRVYSAYASEPNRESSSPSKAGNTLVITLTGPDQQRCSAHLSSRRKSAIFEGDRLPGNLSSIDVQVFLKKE